MGGNNPWPTREELALERAAERIAGQQEEDVAALKKAAAAFRDVVAALALPLGMPGETDHDEMLELLDTILRTPAEVSTDAAWEAAREARQDYHDAVADARRDLREGV